MHSTPGDSADERPAAKRRKLAPAENLPAEVERTILESFKAGDFGRCIVLCNTALKSYPDDAFALNKRLEARYAQRDYNGCIRECTALLKAFPGNACFLGMRGDAFRNVDRYEDSIQDCTAALKHAPGDDFALWNRAEAYRLVGNYRNCIQDCEALLGKRRIADYVRVTALWNLAEAIRVYREDFKGCIDYCTQALQLDPRHTFALWNRAQAYLKLGHFSFCVSDCTAALAEYPDDASVLQTRANAYYYLQEYELCARDCTACLRIDSNDTEARAVLQVAQKAKGDDSQVHRTLGETTTPKTTSQQRIMKSSAGRKTIKEALSKAFLPTIHEKEAAQQRSLAQRFFKIRDYAQCLDACTIALQIDPRCRENATIFLMRAECFFAVKRYDSCLGDCKKSLEQSGPKTDIHELRARVWFEQKEYVLSLGECNMALQACSTNTKAYLTRSRVYLWKENFKSCVADCEAVLLREPNWRALAVRSEAYLKSGRLEEAHADVSAACTKRTDPELKELKQRVISALVRELHKKCRELYDSRKYPECISVASRIRNLAGSIPSVVECIRLSADARLLQTPKDYSGCFEDCAAVLRICKEDIHILLTRSSANLELNRHEECIRDCGIFLASNPSSYKALLFRATAYRLTQKWKLCVIDCNRIIDTRPSYIPALRQRCCALRELQENVGCLEDCAVILRACPNDPAALRNRAAARFNVGDYSGCLSDCDAVLRQQPQYTSVVLLKEEALKKQASTPC